MESGWVVKIFPWTIAYNTFGVALAMVESARGGENEAELARGCQI